MTHASDSDPSLISAAERSEARFIKLAGTYFETNQLISRVVEVGCAAVVEGGDVDGVAGPRGGVGRRGRLPGAGAAQAGPVEGTARSCKVEKSLTQNTRSVQV